MNLRNGFLFLIGFLLSGCTAAESSGREIVVDPGEITLVFSGDVMQHMPQVSAARREDGTYDYRSVFRYIRPLWESVDFAIVNLETTLAGEGKKYSGYPMFASPKALAAALEDAGVDVIALANNHCCDRGAYGIRTTIQTVDSLGIMYTGVYADSLTAGNCSILEKQGFRVGLLNFTYGMNGMPVPGGMVVNQIDTVDMLRQMAEIRKDSITHLVLFLHWGEEYERPAGREQRELAQWCRRNGADVVIGSHPHVVQQIDTARRVVYSLGNFVSNQRERYQDGGISVKVTFSKGREPVIEMLPHWVWIPENREEVRRDYYVVPAYVDGVEIGMKNSEYEAFIKSLEDNRRIVGEVNEIVL